MPEAIAQTENATIETMPSRMRLAMLPPQRRVSDGVQECCRKDEPGHHAKVTGQNAKEEVSRLLPERCLSPIDSLLTLPGYCS